MRVSSIVLALFMVVGVANAQGPSEEPVGTLAQLMRGILFPNSNILFDAQTTDPEEIIYTANEGTTTATFSEIYTGWPVVENAALALAEVSNLIMLADRMCENGRPVPLADAEFMQYARELKEVGIAALEVARTRDLEAMSDITNEIAGACENCHTLYRRYPEENRCQKP
jgi:hypothetical protein